MSIITLLKILISATLVVGKLRAAGPNHHQCNGSRSLNPAVVRGKRFFDSETGEYIPVKGIAFYPRPNDGPLEISDSVDYFTEEFRYIWEPAIENFIELGVNAIRIYGVNPSVNHDAFMCALEEAGIYVIIGLAADCFECGVLADPAPDCYPPSLKTRGQFVINTFSKYKNTLAFSAGNEVALFANNQGGNITWNAPCQKKFIRDMRAYIQTCNAVPSSILPRRVPIGVVVADKDRSLNALYYGCRSDPDDDLENAEWFGINTYLHCDPDAVSIDELDGYIALKQNFSSYRLPIPVVIAEYGCRERFPTIGGFEAQRTWLQVDALFSEPYQEEFAGAVAFEYSAERRIADLSPQKKPWPYFEFMKLQYGVGYFSPLECDHLDIPCQYNKYPEFQLLSAKLRSINVSFVPSIDEYIVEEPPTFPECPMELDPIAEFIWESDSEIDLPCYTVPTQSPTEDPSLEPTKAEFPSLNPTVESSAQPTETGTLMPSVEDLVSPFPTGETVNSAQMPSQSPSLTLIPTRSVEPTSIMSGKTQEPSIQFTNTTTSAPSTEGLDSSSPTRVSPDPSQTPSRIPTEVITQRPTQTFSKMPTQVPTQLPSQIPTRMITQSPSQNPTCMPSQDPSETPTVTPTALHTVLPTQTTSNVPTTFLSSVPSTRLSTSPTSTPTPDPTVDPNNSNSTQVPTDSQDTDSQANDSSTAIAAACWYSSSGLLSFMMSLVLI